MYGETHDRSAEKVRLVLVVIGVVLAFAQELVWGRHALATVELSN